MEIKFWTPHRRGVVLVTVSAPHRLGGGSEDIDFFSFLVGFAVLDALHSCEDGALDLVYSLLDADGVGKVPRSRVDVALQLRPCLLYTSDAADD